jgi:hypothetical protein
MGKETGAMNGEKNQMFRRDSMVWCEIISTDAKEISECLYSSDLHPFQRVMQVKY